MLQNATVLRKSAPWPPNISDEHVCCIAPATRNASLRIVFQCPRLPSFTFCSLVAGCRIPCACHTKRALREHVVFEMCLALQRHALFRHLNLNFQKSPKLRCFVHFDFEMCFASQRRPLFRHLNFQKCSKPVSF